MLRLQGAEVLIESKSEKRIPGHALSPVGNTGSRGLVQRERPGRSASAPESPLAAPCPAGLSMERKLPRKESHWRGQGGCWETVKRDKKFLSIKSKSKLSGLSATRGPSK